MASHSAAYRAVTSSIEGFLDRLFRQTYPSIEQFEAAPPNSPQAVVEEVVRPLQVRCLGVEDGNALIFQDVATPPRADTDRLLDDISRVLSSAAQLHDPLRSIAEFRLVG